MLSILVGHCYFLRLDQKQWQRAKPYPPLATLQVAAALRQAGHEVSLFDAMLAQGTPDYDAELDRTTPQLALFYEDNFNFLTRMCLGRMRDAARHMIASAHRASARVIVAGSDASDAPKAYLDAGADVVLIGEGLGTLHALVDRLDANPLLPIKQLTDGLTGVASKIHGKVSVAKFTAFPVSQQYRSLPAWDLVDMQRYRSVWRSAHGYFSLNIAASRGCSFRYHWCAKPIGQNRYLQRPAADVAAEMAYVKRTFHPDHIWFADDIFGFRVDWIAEFAAALRAQAGFVPFTIQSRADLISSSMARALKEAGCREVWIGAESGSQKILDAMHKGTAVEDIPHARARLAAQGIRVGFFIQLGYLGEKLEDILATRALLDSSCPDDIGVNVSYPLPGTKFYDLVEAQIREKTRWQESNDLEMMFEGTYASAFYRAVRDLLHDQVSIEKLNRLNRRGDYRREKRSLTRRWEHLIASENRYRVRTSPAAAAN